MKNPDGLPRRCCLALVASLIVAAVSAEQLPQPPTPQALLTQYGSGQYDDVLQTISRLAGTERLASSGAKPVAELAQEAGRIVPSWIADAGEPQKALRARIASAFALEVASVALDQRASGFIEWFNVGLNVRRARPDPEFDRSWYLAGLALLQRTQRPPVVEQFIRMAKPALPREPQLPLAQAVNAELGLPDRRLRLDGTPSVTSGPDSTLMSRTGPVHPRTTVPSGNPLPADPRLVEARRLFELAQRLEPIRAEATVRLGRVLSRLHEDKQALAALRKVPELTHDAELRHLSHLFEAAIHERADRPDDAIAAYRAALKALPSAHTASMLLALQLHDRGDNDDAAAIADRALTSPPVADPWLRYLTPGLRHWPERIAKVREALRSSRWGN